MHICISHFTQKKGEEISNNCVSDILDARHHVVKKRKFCYRTLRFQKKNNFSVK